MEIVELKKCTSCGFYLPLDEYHADNNWREDQKDVWCKGCKHNSKVQGKFITSQGHLPFSEITLHAVVPSS